MILLGIALEGFTCLLRFGGGLRSVEETGWLAAFTLGWRIHHGYVDALMVLVGAHLRSRAWRNLLLIAGVGIFLSDVMHHFFILWPLTGSPEFDLRYPPRT